MGKVLPVGARVSSLLDLSFTRSLLQSAISPTPLKLGFPNIVNLSKYTQASPT